MAASEKPEKTAYVYMVRCAGGQLYTGWTNDPEARLKAHQSGKGAKYTRITKTSLIRNIRGVDYSIQRPYAARVC